MKIIHLSDTHLLDHSSNKLYGIKPAKRLKRAFESIMSFHSDALFVTITGDLSQSGCEDSYRTLKKLSGKLIMPLFPILGNHDVRAVFSRVFPQFVNDGFVQYVREFEGRVFIFVDTLVEREEYGALCDQRLQWLGEQLEKYSDKAVYIFMHHHPLASGLMRMDSVANFRSLEEFWRQLESYPNIRHIFFGHIHHPMYATKNGIGLSSTRSTAFQVPYRTDMPEEYVSKLIQPAYSVIKIDDAGVSSHLYEYLIEGKFS